jgi:hypothetical protein
MRPTMWRVRVKRSVEVWVDVQGISATDAENQAGNLPGITHVFPKSAIRGDEANRPERQIGVEE